MAWKSVIGLSISVALLWWVFRGEDLGAIATEIAAADPWWLLASASVATGGNLVRAMRWKVLLSPLRPHTGLGNRFAATMIGFMANNLLPARAGELVRAWSFARMEKMSVSGCLASLAVERFLDGVIIVTLLVLSLSLPGFPADAAIASQSFEGALAAMVAVLAIFAIAATVVLWRPGLARAVARPFASRLPGRAGERVLPILDGLIEGLGALRRPSLLIRGMVWSLFFWALAFGFVLAGLPRVRHRSRLRGGALSERNHRARGGDPVRARLLRSLRGRGAGRTRQRPRHWRETRRWRSPRAITLQLSSPSPRSGSGTRGAWVLAQGDGGGGWDRACAPSRRPPGAWRGVRRARFAGGSGDVSGAVFVEAPAKVNLVLRVGARRADGYHNVDTLFAAVGLRDRLWVERTAGGITVEVTGADLGDPRDNLVYKAARAYLAARGGRGGVAIRLEKRIPIGGGLGGGSSDAAATLRCLDELFARPAGLPALVEVAGSLGSDVPFFLSSSPLALGSGRGDRLTPLPVLPSLPLLLVGSSQGVGTAWAYNLLARGREEGGAGVPTRPPRPLTAARCSDWETIVTLAHNDFEAPVFAARPDLCEAMQSLRASTPLLALMSGSGSTLFGVYRNRAAAERAQHRLELTPGSRCIHLTNTLSSFPAVKAL